MRIMTTIRAAAFLAASWSCLAPAATGTCGSHGLRVSAASPAQVREACRAVRTAARVIAELGFAMPVPVKIRVQSIPHPAVPESSVVAEFDASSCVISVAPYRKTIRDKKHIRDGLAPTASQWRGYVVHEIAHAAVHTNCKESCPDRGTHEYIATVAQLLSLPAEERRAFLARFADLEPFAAEAEISETYYLIDPQRFSAKAYLHFLSAAGGTAFIRRRIGR